MTLTSIEVEAVCALDRIRRAKDQVDLSEKNLAVFRGTTRELHHRAIVVKAKDNLAAVIERESR